MTLLAASPRPELAPWFPLIFVGGWVVVNFALSLTGWSGLAERYRARVRPPGKAFNVPGASFGNLFGSYRNVVRVIFTQEGTYFYVLFLFRAFHPPFLLPWESVERVVEKKSFFTGRYYELLLVNMGGSIDLRLSGKAGEELLKCVPEGRVQRVG
jgi:hypothetical protein